ncbi:hypothetical protein ACWT_1914 [Actinoplanes sp. SE50]|uniref:hypothetical protein n=1 Tax=unclassified Actinoplanes TaxID=2626549 RepID=UPI00023EBEB7|nr:MULTISPECIES: hypothetical protein [unclassified Actinoplanes]AEV82933.1 hypothetical protein ACPL_2036 [Actinoplanes sp. SE50/110]ATO81329.1 hypothetical protein ACWT_1914 [Actinoplanes sp. SE50]SLL98736.1 uncharacterized protein ACSP50_1963 [Actinoplanes sp. SE50/110]
MSAFRNYAMSLISASVTVVIGLLSDIVFKLSNNETFIVVSTGAVVSLAVALIEQRMNSDQKEFRAHITAEMAEKLDLFRMIDEIDDPQLRAEVFLLARRLSIGEVPSHIAAIRTPMLYDRARSTVYASNVSLTRPMLYRWDSLARFRRIVEVSGRRSAEGVTFTRTFFLSRRQIIAPDGRWDERSWRTLRAQTEAGIAVRIVWAEDLELDNLPPHRKLVRDLTIFDSLEAVDTTGVQVIYRHPSDRLREFLDIEKEQLKYSESFDRYTGVELVDLEELAAAEVAGSASG